MQGFEIDREPLNITKSEMRLLAEHIEQYLDLYESIFIVPEHLGVNKKQIKNAILLTRRLIRKLRDGDISVFKDIDDWNNS